MSTETSIRYTPALVNGEAPASKDKVACARMNKHAHPTRSQCETPRPNIVRCQITGLVASCLRSEFHVGRVKPNLRTRCLQDPHRRTCDQLAKSELRVKVAHNVRMDIPHYLHLPLDANRGISLRYQACGGSFWGTLTREVTFQRCIPSVPVTAQADVYILVSRGLKESLL